MSKPQKFMDRSASPDPPRPMVLCNVLVAIGVGYTNTGVDKAKGGPGSRSGLTSFHGPPQPKVDKCKCPYFWPNYIA